MKLSELLLENYYTPEGFLDVFGLDECTEHGGKFYSDYPVSINCDSRRDLDHLPVDFGVTKDFAVFGSKQLNTLKGFPEECHTLQIFDCPEIKSLKHCTPIIYGNFDIRMTGITSLVGISDIIKRINGAIFLSSNRIEEGGIGLIMIEGLKDIQPTGYSEMPWPIIRKYLGRPEDLFECQAELIEKGYEEYAKL